MSKSLAVKLGVWKIGCLAIALGCILASAGGQAHAASTYVLTPDIVTTPTAANQAFSVILKLDGPPEHMGSYSLRLYYNSAVYTIDDATNNTNSPSAGVGLDLTSPDSANSDGDPETNMIGVIQAAESYLTGWSVPGNMALLHCTTSASFTTQSAIRLTVLDNPGPNKQPQGFYTIDDKQFVHNNDKLNSNPGPFSWTQTYFVPVGLSSFSVE